MNKTLLAMAIIFCVWSCNMGQNPQEDKNMKSKHSHKFTNQLIHESSPYLLQHARNPVNWYPWGTEALDKAKAENKLLLISVGYSACHWCHVMERESFENEEIAAIMNEHFVCIKVDREERPDIDQIYMNAVQLISGRGGWPLNCFALPDGRPFYGGTYFRPQQFEKLLISLASTYKNEKETVIDYANKLHQGILQSEVIFDKSESAPFKLTYLKELVAKTEGRFDYHNGGQNGAPKFPMPGFYDFLLQWSQLTKNKETEEYVLLTLDKMANGGIYDHLGGGFARYATDEMWLAPHFEKMLYDNAQLVSLYSKAYRLEKKELYKRTIVETLAFVKNEMMAPDGGFYAAYDADSEGEEGKFYVWQKGEIETILGEDAPAFMAYYDVTNAGNWEGKNILNVANESLYTNQIARSKQKLYKHRSNRVKPGLDDKILTSWNAMMIKAYVDAYIALGDEEYLDIAKESAQLLLYRQLQKDGKLMRNFKAGQASIDGFLDDYALLAEAMLSLYGVSFDVQWLNQTRDLLAYVMKHFYDENSGMFFYTSDEATGLIARKMELSDNVIPASSSVMAKVLFEMGKLDDNSAHSDMAQQMLSNMSNSTNSDAYFSFNWLSLMSQYVFPYYEVVLTGPNAHQLRQELENKYHPNILVVGGTEESVLPLLEYRVNQDRSLIYVCVNNSCQLPVETIEEARTLLK